MGNVTWELLGIRAGILYIPARTSLLYVLLVGYRIDETLGINFFIFIISYQGIVSGFTFSTLDVDTVSVCFFLR